jgi:PAS domain S-box-containing protein
VTGAWTSDPAFAGSVLASSPLATIVVDEDLVVRAFNPAAERLTGRPGDDVVGRTAADLFAHGDEGTSLAPLRAALDGRREHVEVELRTADGAAVPVGVSWSPLHHDGARVGLVGVGRDITRRKSLEHELATMADSFRALAASSELSMYRFRFDPELHVDHVNPGFERTLGVTGQELIADPSPLWERLDAGAQRELARARAGEPVRWPIDGRWAHPDGRTLELQMHEVPLRSVSGRLEGALGIVRDVSELRREQRALASALELERDAADRLRRIDELRQLFLQAVSHELRTPLTAVLGFGVTLRDRADQLPADRIAGLAGRVHRQAERMQRLLDDLLDVDRLSRGVLTLDRAFVDVADLVRRVAGDHDDGSLQLDLEPCPAELDPVKVERIVVNLLRNAHRHAGPDATVRVTVSAGDPVRIVVEDDGPGVPPELRETVFRPFEQGTTAHGSPSPGTGIGLTLVAAFAELHGGRASVDRGALGGARFVVELPTSADRR